MGPKNHDLKNGAAFLPVVVQLLHGIIAVTDGGDRVCFDSQLSVLLGAQDGRIEVKKAAGKLNLINGVHNRIYVKSLNTGNDTSINVFSNFSL